MPMASRPPSDRVCKDVPYPIVHKLRLDELFDFRSGEKANIALLVHHLRNEGSATTTFLSMKYLYRRLL